MLAAIAAALVLSAAPAIPATPASAKPAFDPGAAVELARIGLPRGNYDQIARQARAQLDQAMASSLERQPKVVKDQLPANALEMMQGIGVEMFDAVFPSYEEMIDFEAGLLSKHFTGPELAELLAFYRSPLGVKAIRIQPEVLQDAMGWMQNRVNERMGPVSEKMQARIQAWIETEQAREKQGGEKPKRTEP